MIVSVRDVSFTYPGGEASVLNNLSIEFEAGEFCAVVGGNGSGKTSFCKLLTGLIPHYYHGDFAGEVVVDGSNSLEVSVGELAHRVGFVYQDFENQLLRPRVIDDVGFAAMNYGHQDYRERAERALDALSLGPLRDKIIWELSGGEQHLVALAGALSLDPPIILIDEPVSQLDPVHARTVYEHLRVLNREFGKTVVVVEHFTDFIGEYCDTVALLDAGACLWKSDATTALSRVEELERYDIAPPQVTTIVHALGGIDRLPTKIDEAVDFFSALGRPPAKLSANGRTHADKSDRIVHLDQVSHFYFSIGRARHTVIKDLTLSFHTGERVALVGANGSGKSTILKMLAGLIRPRGGTVTVAGLDTAKSGPEKISQRASFVYQSPEQMFIEDSIRRDIAYFPTNRDHEGVDRIVDELLDQFNLVEIADRDGRLLSGGQMRRASLAIGSGMKPQLLLLDEPTSSLDVQNRRQIVTMLDRLADRILLTIIATHDMELVAEWADRVVVMSGGECLTDCSPRELFSSSELMAAARVRAPQVVELSNRLGYSPAFVRPAEMIAAYSEGVIHVE